MGTRSQKEREKVEYSKDKDTNPKKESEKVKFSKIRVKVRKSLNKLEGFFFKMELYNAVFLYDPWSGFIFSTKLSQPRISNLLWPCHETRAES